MHATPRFSCFRTLIDVLPVALTAAFGASLPDGSSGAGGTGEAGGAAGTGEAGGAAGTGEGGGPLEVTGLSACATLNREERRG